MILPVPLFIFARIVAGADCGFIIAQSARDTCGALICIAGATRPGLRK
jgi:hypothetical protein